MSRAPLPLLFLLPALAQNVLFIAVDDLRVNLGLYGTSTLTPNADALAARGVAFSRAYCQVSVCSPSRTSFLTGTRPDVTHLWTIGPYFRTTGGAAAKKIVTLPQAMKLSGRNTTGAGKVWHPGTSSGGEPSWGGLVGGDDMPHSFSLPPGAAASGIDPRLLVWECDAWGNSTGQSAASAGLPGAMGCVTSSACVACLVAHNGTNGHSWVTTPCSDSCYVDAMIAEHVSDELRLRAATKEPFALFLGFKRPHLGFQIPEKALAVYPPDVPIAAARVPPPGYPPAGWYTNVEIETPDIKPFVEHNNVTFPGLIEDVKHAELRRAYYASVSWMDEQLGKVLATLDETGLAENTWVTFVGDHGWSLGEHGNWAKQQMFEHAVRVPLIIAPPRGEVGWRRGVILGPDDDAFVEALDLMPTLVEALAITGVPAGQMQGRSLLPLLREGGSRNISSSAFSQIVRSDGRACAPPDATLHLADPQDTDPPALLAQPDAPPCAMGVTMRVFGWRYTAWVGYVYTGDAVGPVWSDLRGEELYDHSGDDAHNGVPFSFDADELVNLADDARYADVKATLSARLQREWGARGESR